jgi:hypothetical protein
MPYGTNAQWVQKVYDFPGGPVNGPSGPVPGYVQWRDVELARGWFQLAQTKMRLARLPAFATWTYVAQTNLIAEIWICISWGYLALNLPPVADPQFIEMWNRFISGYPRSDRVEFDEHYDSVVRDIRVANGVIQYMSPSSGTLPPIPDLTRPPEQVIGLLRQRQAQNYLRSNPPFNWFLQKFNVPVGVSWIGLPTFKSPVWDGKSPFHSEETTADPYGAAAQRLGAAVPFTRTNPFSTEPAMPPLSTVGMERGAIGPSAYYNGLPIPSQWHLQHSRMPGASRDCSFGGGSPACTSDAFEADMPVGPFDGAWDMACSWHDMLDPAEWLIGQLADRNPDEIITRSRRNLVLRFILNVQYNSGQANLFQEFSTAAARASIDRHRPDAQVDAIASGLMSVAGATGNIYIALIGAVVAGGVIVGNRLVDHPVNEKMDQFGRFKPFVDQPYVSGTATTTPDHDVPNPPGWVRPATSSFAGLSVILPVFSTSTTGTPTGGPLVLTELAQTSTPAAQAARRRKGVILGGAAVAAGSAAWLAWKALRK